MTIGRPKNSNGVIKTGQGGKSIVIPEDLLWDIKALAALERRSISELATEVLSEYVKAKLAKINKG